MSLKGKRRLCTAEDFPPYLCKSLIVAGMLCFCPSKASSIKPNAAHRKPSAGLFQFSLAAPTQTSTWCMTFLLPQLHWVPNAILLTGPLVDATITMVLLYALIPKAAVI